MKSAFLGVPIYNFDLLCFMNIQMKIYFFIFALVHLLNVLMMSNFGISGIETTDLEFCKSFGRSKPVFSFGLVLKSESSESPKYRESQKTKNFQQMPWPYLLLTAKHRQGVLRFILLTLVPPA